MNKPAVVEQGAAVAAPQPVTPAQMLVMAVEQNADIEKLEKLMLLQERWEANLAEKSFVRAMSSFRADCPPICKTKEGHNSSYAGLAESIDQIKDVLAMNGLSHSWSTSQENQTISVTCTIRHVDGHSESTVLAAGADGTGNKNSIQAIGSTVSYLQRYTLYAILGLASQDADDDGNTGQARPAGGAPNPAAQPATPQMLANLRSAIKDAGVSDDAFCKKVQIERLEDIPQGRVGGAINWLKGMSQERRS